MRFQQYLEQNATPHWRHAYIDYAACDRQICVIAARIGGTAVKDTDEDEDHGPTARVKIKAGRPRPSESGLRRQFVAPPHVSLPSLLFSTGLGGGLTPEVGLTAGSSMDILGKSDVPHVDLHDRLSFVGSSGGSEDASKAAPVTPLASPHPLASSVLLPSPPLPKQTTTSLTVPTKPSRESTSASHVHTYPGAQTLQELYDSLEPDEYGFFHILNREVDKIERFYTRREADATLKFEQLSGQMVTINIKTQIHPETRVKRAEEKVETVERATTKLPGFDDPIQTDESSHEEDKQGLRRDLCEYYHNLELLKNFRLVNISGVHKALKKFEKTTKIPCMDLYVDDRLARQSVSKEKPVDKLLDKTEELYADNYSGGDIEDARRNLRAGDIPTTYYDNVYPAAFMVGLGLPPVVLGIVKYFEAETRREIPAYEALMVVYSAFYLPVIFALLFQLNLDAWVSMRINYEYVMELSRPSLDHRCYHEIPAFLFMTLSYCFFSFYRVAPHSVAPTTWPSAWLVFVCVFFLNPVRTCHGRARWWFVRVVANVLTPGLASITFIFFFLADILASHTYTIQNIYLLGCVAAHKWPDDAFAVCKTSDWTFALLGSLASIARLLQCLKRFWDTRLWIHLFNALKYSIGIITVCLGVWTSSRGFTHDALSLSLYIIFAVINSGFACAWDIIVDWSLLRPGYKCLRPDLAFPSRWLYYAAMVWNVLVRFDWVWNFPVAGREARLRSWLFALAEILRRWVWNFFRVETEHLGNSDTYRSDRPAPVRRLVTSSDQPNSRNAHKGVMPVGFDKLDSKLVGTEAGRGPDALNVGARGRAATREYESRRPGDASASDDEPTV